MKELLRVAIIKIDRIMLRAPRLLRRPWEWFRGWYSWRCDVCRKRSGSMQLTNASLRCQTHKLEIEEREVSA